MVIFTIQGYTEVKKKTFNNVGCLDFSTFERIALESYVYLIFDQFECTDFIGMVYFTIHDYLEVKTKTVIFYFSEEYVLQGKHYLLQVWVSDLPNQKETCPITRQFSLAGHPLSNTYPYIPPPPRVHLVVAVC